MYAHPLPGLALCPRLPYTVYKYSYIVMNARNKNPTTLEQVLRRGDVWRGHSRAFIPQEVHSSGFVELDKALLNAGWPISRLIECRFRHKNCSGEWLLFTPLIKALYARQEEAFLVLLNPPATPFAPALIQNGIPLNQLLIVESKSKQDFIAGFIEFTRSSHCLALLAWQPPYSLNYSELRKCQLACAEGKGLYTLFRPAFGKHQSSPAPLRLEVGFTNTCLEVEIFKQQGLFNKRLVRLELGGDIADTLQGINRVQGL